MRRCRLVPEFYVQAYDVVREPDLVHTAAHLDLDVFPEILQH